MTGDVDRRERGPWKPEKGKYVRIWPLRVEVSEPVGIVLAVVVGVPVLAVLLLLIFSLIGAL